MAPYLNRKIVLIFSLVLLNYLVFNNALIYFVIFVLGIYSIIQFIGHVYQQKIVTAEFDGTCLPRQLVETFSR